MTRTELETAMDWIEKVTDEICPQDCSLWAGDEECPYRMTRGDGVVKCAFDAVEEAVKQKIDRAEKLTLVPGSMWKHFKGGVYQIVLVCTDSHNPDTKLVIYQNTDTGDVWSRPVSEFLEKLDPAKYPDAEQMYRFERV